MWIAKRSGAGGGGRGGVKKVTEGNRSSICSLPWQCHKTVMGEEVDRWQLGGERQEIEKERMDRVGDWMSKPEGRAIAGWCIYRTESKNKRNYRAACGFVFLWVKTAVPQQIRNNTVAISLPTALHQHIYRTHICSVFPFDILPLFFNTRPILLSTRNPTLIAKEHCHRGWVLGGWGCWDLVNLWEAFNKLTSTVVDRAREGPAKWVVELKIWKW